MTKHTEKPDLEEQGRDIVQRMISMADVLLIAADELKAIADSLRLGAPDDSRTGRGG